MPGKWVERYSVVGTFVGRCLCFFPHVMFMLFFPGWEVSCDYPVVGISVGGVYVFCNGTSLVHVSQASGRT